jgi:hypothetical protein
MGLRRRLERLEGSGGACPECRITPETGFRVRVYGLPPKPRSNPQTTYAPPGEKPRETCRSCGGKLPVIRLKGLTDKPRGVSP